MLVFPPVVEVVFCVVMVVVRGTPISPRGTVYVRVQGGDHADSVDPGVPCGGQVLRRSCAVGQADGGRAAEAREAPERHHVSRPCTGAVAGQGAGGGLLQVVQGNRPHTYTPCIRTTLIRPLS